MKAVLAVLLLAAAYVAGAQLGFLAAPIHSAVSSAWPPAGIALATLLLYGTRLWPGVALGAVTANLLAGVVAPAAAVIAAGNTMEALAGVWVLRTLAFRPDMERLRDVLVLAGTALTVTALSATIGVGALWIIGGAAPPAGFGLGLLWMSWWTGDAIGIIVVAPLLLLWAAAPPLVRITAALIEPTLLVIVLAALTGFMVGSAPVPFVYPVFPIAMLAAYRLGPRGAATANATVAIVAAYFTVQGVGSFVLAAGTPTENLFLFQGFVALLAITTLCSAAVLAERRRAEADLRENVTCALSAQRSLEASEAKFATMFRASPVGICVIALDTMELIDANARFYEMVGDPPTGSVIGVSPRQLGMWAEPGELRDLIARLRLQGSVREIPVKYLTREGQERRALAALEVMDIGGKACAVALFWRP